MQPLTILEHLDVLKDGLLSLPFGLELRVVHHLGLEFAPERFHHGIVITVATRSLRSRTLWAIKPGVVTRAGDIKHMSHDFNLELVAMIMNEGELHSCSFAKYAAAFLKCPVPCALARALFRAHDYAALREALLAQSRQETLTERL